MFIKNQSSRTIESNKEKYRLMEEQITKNLTDMIDLLKKLNKSNILSNENYEQCKKGNVILEEKIEKLKHPINRCIDSTSLCFRMLKNFMKNNTICVLNITQVNNVCVYTTKDSCGNISHFRTSNMKPSQLLKEYNDNNKDDKIKIFPYIYINE